MEPARPAAHVEPRSLVEQRMARIHVVEDHHVLGAVAVVGHRVVDLDGAGAQRSFDAAHKLQVFAVEDRLAHAALDPHAVLVAVPRAVRPHVRRAQVGEPSMQALLAGLVVVVHRVAHVGQPAGHQQAQHRGANPALAAGLVARALHVAGRRAERQGNAAVRSARNVQGPSGEHGESQAGPGVEVDRLHAVAGAAVQAVFADAADLGEVANARHQLRAGVVTSPERWHQVIPHPYRETHCRWARGRRASAVRGEPLGKLGTGSVEPRPLPE